MKRISKVSLITLLAVSMVLCMAGPVGAASTPRIYLGAADSFAILSYAGITDGPPVLTSQIVDGDIGTTPAAGTSITGITSTQVLSGFIYTVGPAGPTGYVENPGLLTTAKTAQGDAYTAAANSTPFTTLVGDPVPADNQLGGKTLYPGVYRFGAATTANLIGTLTLDANGDPDPVWIFQATSTLVTAALSEVVFLNTGSPCDVFWQVGSSATIGTETDFVGNILASDSVGMFDAATLDGSAHALNGSVTLINNTITKGPCALAPPVTPITPEAGMPYTGFDGTARVLPWNIVGIAVTVLAIGLVCAFAILKTKREKKEIS